jgi:hypothetical protein
MKLMQKMDKIVDYDDFDGVVGDFPCVDEEWLIIGENGGNPIQGPFAVLHRTRPHFNPSVCTMKADACSWREAMDFVRDAINAAYMQDADPADFSALYDLNTEDLFAACVRVVAQYVEQGGDTLEGTLGAIKENLDAARVVHPDDVGAVFFATGKVPTVETEDTHNMIQPAGDIAHGWKWIGGHDFVAWSSDDLPNPRTLVKFGAMVTRNSSSWNVRVFTVGQGGDEDDVLFESNVRFIETAFTVADAHLAVYTR